MVTLKTPYYNILYTTHAETSLYSSRNQFTYMYIRTRCTSKATGIHNLICARNFSVDHMYKYKYIIQMYMYIHTQTRLCTHIMREGKLNYSVINIYMENVW